MDKKDKEILMGAVLLEAGIIGFVGLAIAASLLAGPGAAENPFQLILSRMDSPALALVWLAFAAMAAAGLLVCVKTLLNKE